MLMFGRREQDQFDPLGTVDPGVILRRDFKEVADADVCLDASGDHSDDQFA